MLPLLSVQVGNRHTLLHGQTLADLFEPTFDVIVVIKINLMPLVARYPGIGCDIDNGEIIANKVS